MHRLVALTVSIVTCVSNARADALKLANGDTLNGEIVSWAVDHVVIEHPQLGPVRLSLDQLAIDTGDPPARGLFDTRFLRGWDRRINVGASGQQGGSESTNITAALNFGYEDEFKRWVLRGRYFYNRSDDGDNDNNARADLRRDWLFPESAWFARSAFRYQFDEFESWKHRTIVGVGPGYHLLKREAHSLDVVLAPTFTREYGEGGTDKAELDLAFDYAWKISKNMKLTVSNNMFNNLSPDAGEIRNTTLAEWRLRVAEKPDLNLGVGLDNEYETNPDPGDDNNDLKYYLTLGVDF